MTPEERPRQGDTPAGPNTWEPSLFVWEILLVSAILLTVVFIVTGGMTVPEKAVAAGCLFAVLPLYLLFGRPALVADDLRRGTVYIVALVVLFCGALVAPISAFALFGLCPQCFIIHPARTAMIPVVVLSVAHVPRHLLLNGPGGYKFLTVTVVVILFSAVFGVWSEWVTERSTERAALIRELVGSRAEVARLSAERGA
ncbi:hypothetical protein ACFQ08_28965, partial [Streptosporangium algeriense]